MVMCKDGRRWVSQIGEMFYVPHILDVTSVSAFKTAVCILLTNHF